MRISTWYEHESTQEAFSFLRFSFAQNREVMLLPVLGDDYDLGKKPIKPIRCVRARVCMWPGWVGWCGAFALCSSKPCCVRSSFAGVLELPSPHVLSCLCVVCVWCACGVRVVCVWCACGVRVVCVWCACGVFVCLQLGE